MLKVCSTCKKAQPTKEYSACNKVKSGLNARCKTCEKIRHKKDYESNKDYNLEWARKYREENYERRREVEKKSHAKNKEKHRPAHNARQSVRNKILNEKKYLILDKELHKIYNSPCFNCGSMENQSLDHIIPVSRGGNHSIGNVMTLCLKCNMSKHARTITEWKHSKNMLGVG
jgi:5-methylcytosine-specific restriction endonuclease McrA